MKDFDRYYCQTLLVSKIIRSLRTSLRQPHANLSRRNILIKGILCLISMLTLALMSACLAPVFRKHIKTLYRKIFPRLLQAHLVRVQRSRWGRFFDALGAPTCRAVAFLRESAEPGPTPWWSVLITPLLHARTTPAFQMRLCRRMHFLILGGLSMIKREVWRSPSRTMELWRYKAHSVIGFNGFFLMPISFYALSYVATVSRVPNICGLS